MNVHKSVCLKSIGCLIVKEIIFVVRVFTLSSTDEETWLCRLVVGEFCLQLHVDMWPNPVCFFECVQSLKWNSSFFRSIFFLKTWKFFFRDSAPHRQVYADHSILIILFVIVTEFSDVFEAWHGHYVSCAQTKLLALFCSLSLLFY